MSTCLPIYNRKNPYSKKSKKYGIMKPYSDLCLQPQQDINYVFESGDNYILQNGDNLIFN